MRCRVLCVEDDSTVQTLIGQCLENFNVTFAGDLKTAQKELAGNTFDAVLLDIELPDGDGLRFYSKISRDLNAKKIPTLFLSGHSDISNKLLAFSVGADDFIAKPFDPLELRARLESKMKRRLREIEDKKVRRVGNLEIDFDRQRVFLTNNGSEKDLGLTSIELRILSALSKRVEQILSREQILSSVWGSTAIVDRTVDSHIAHLRSKLAESLVVVETVKNFGYRLTVGKSSRPQNAE